jgi:flagellar biosynthesis protein FlhB
MHDDGRYIPPGSGRRAAFAQKGGFPKSSLLSAGVAILVMSAVFFLFKNYFLSGLTDAFRVGLENAAVKKTSADIAVNGAAAAALHWIAPVLLSAAGGLCAVVILSTLVSGKGKGSTAVPLPKMPTARLPIAVIRIFAAVVFVASALCAIRGTTIDGANPAAWIEGIAMLFFRVSAALGGILILAGGAEVLAMRHQIFRALFLNRSEAGREMRAETGNRVSLKKAWARARLKADL